MLKTGRLDFKKEKDGKPNVTVEVRDNNGAKEVVITYAADLIATMMEQVEDKENFSLEGSLTMSAISELMGEALSHSKNMGLFYHLITILHSEVVNRSIQIEDALRPYIDDQMKKSANRYL